MSKRPPVSIFTALFVAADGALAPGCGKPGDLPTINVGLIAELTGGLSVFGTSSKNAAELKVAEIEQRGGIDVGGRKYRLKLVISDSESTPEGALADAQSFI